MLANYRPISLTNVDYKILAFVLANRLQTVIKSIVNPAQVAYIKGRYIGCNIRLLEDVIDYYDNNQKGGVLMMLDFCKAFDSLEWNFLIDVLKRFNFGQSFIRWIQTLYNKPSACVKNNGYFSNNFPLHRGIRQGCPVSALLFIIATEIMAITLRQNTKIQGIGICDQNIKILQYADDGVLLLNNEQEMCEAIATVNAFSSLSGTILNMSKCEGLWLGTFKERQEGCRLFNIKWPTAPIRCLGIYIGHNKKENEILNWYEKLEQIENSISEWKKRKLTIFGKITVIKTIAIPKILFSASVLPLPDDVVQRLNTIFFDFIWGKKDKIKRNIMIQQISDGGIKMIDVESLFMSVKAVWVVRLLKASPIEDWTMIARHHLKYDTNENLIFKLNMTNVNRASILKTLPKFYQEVITAFNKAKGTSVDTFVKTIFDQPIWGNDCVQVHSKGKTKTLYYKRWIACGLIKVGNLKFVNGLLDETFIHDKVTNKVNILSEIMQVKKALKPYQNQLLNHNPDANTYVPLFTEDCKYIDDFSSTKSKYFYNRLLQLKQIKPPVETYWQNMFTNQEIQFSSVYESKIKNIKDNKLSEFNYKVLHRILPCNVNLVKWKKKNSKQCQLCYSDETIEHLLYNCIFVKTLWNNLGSLMDRPVSCRDVILGTRCKETNFILTLISFLVYKEWLKASLENEPRPEPCLVNYVSELKYRREVYGIAGLKDIAKCLTLLIQKIR